MSIDLTRMECKEIHPWQIVYQIFGIDLTRVEYKDRNQTRNEEHHKRIDLNHNGM